MARLDPALDIEPSGIGGIGPREPAGGKAELPRLRPYCFLKALAFMHGLACSRSP
jgi:hypothetical protein